jgi:hypothetical protein
VACATTHCDNTIELVRLNPDRSREGRTVIAVEPSTEIPAGPSSDAWRRGEGNYGRTACFTTDGGTAESAGEFSEGPKFADRLYGIIVGREEMTRQPER